MTSFLNFVSRKELVIFVLDVKPCYMAQTDFAFPDAPRITSRSEIIRQAIKCFLASKHAMSQEPTKTLYYAFVGYFDDEPLEILPPTSVASAQEIEHAISQLLPDRANAAEKTGAGGYPHSVDDEGRKNLDTDSEFLNVMPLLSYLRYTADSFHEKFNRPALVTAPSVTHTIFITNRKLSAPANPVSKNKEEEDVRRVVAKPPPPVAPIRDYLDVLDLSPSPFQDDCLAFEKLLRELKFSSFVLSSVGTPNCSHHRGLGIGQMLSSCLTWYHHLRRSQGGVMDGGPRSTAVRHLRRFPYPFPSNSDQGSPSNNNNNNETTNKSSGRFNTTSSSTSSSSAAVSPTMAPAGDPSRGFSAAAAAKNSNADNNKQLQQQEVALRRWCVPKTVVNHKKDDVKTPEEEGPTVAAAAAAVVAPTNSKKEEEDRGPQTTTTTATVGDNNHANNNSSTLHRSDKATVVCGEDSPLNGVGLTSSGQHSKVKDNDTEHPNTAATTGNDSRPSSSSTGVVPTDRTLPNEDGPISQPHRDDVVVVNEEPSIMHPGGGGEKRTAAATRSVVSAEEHGVVGRTTTTATTLTGVIVSLPGESGQAHEAETAASQSTTTTLSKSVIETSASPIVVFVDPARQTVARDAGDAERSNVSPPDAPPPPPPSSSAPPSACRRATEIFSVSDEKLGHAAEEVPEPSAVPLPRMDSSPAEGLQNSSSTTAKTIVGVAGEEPPQQQEAALHSKRRVAEERSTQLIKKEERVAAEGVQENSQGGVNAVAWHEL